MLMVAKNYTRRLKLTIKSWTQQNSYKNILQLIAR